MKSKKPSATVQAVTLVEIRFEWKQGEESPGSRFLQWCCKEHVFSLRGFGSVGPGWVTGIYEAKDTQRILDWVRSEGLKLKR